MQDGIESSIVEPVLVQKVDKTVYTVSQLTRDIKSLLETGFESLWVKGEVSSFKCPSSGHFYFNLKDETAMIACVMFRFKNQSLKFTLEDGLEVMCGGRISVYEPRGSYQIILDVIEPVGVGALQLQFEKLKEKLLKEGLFDEHHKKPIPFLPQKIAIITSPTGAAIRDILTVLNRRYANVEVLIIPAAVQGEKAAPEIVRAIEVVNQLGEHEVILVGRGGGSLEDLWAFNEESVARAIFNSKIPIISCVGHEVDFTIADFVADLRAPTPSAAAELVVKNKVDLQKQVLSSLSQLRQAYLGRLKSLKNKLTEFQGRIVDPRKKLQDWQLRLSDLQERLVYTFQQNLKQGNTRLLQLKVHFGTGLKLYFERRKQKLQRLTDLLTTLSPFKILERGYSITHRLKEMNIVRDASSLRPQELVSVQFFKGEVICEVKEIKS
ncbi:MAG: exodeoxyribonuclease VII large subunit [Deltaproteobacteria bacterium]|nr:exodeoxyribonuclease VII large subunit [Deltaproteobacteria bacterium]